MRLDAKSFALAAGLTAAVVSVLCALFVAVAPDAAIALFGLLVHSDFGIIVRPLNWGSVLAGVVCVALTVGAIALLLAALYNRFLGTRAVRPTT